MVEALVGQGLAVVALAMFVVSIVGAAAIKNAFEHLTHVAYAVQRLIAVAERVDQLAIGILEVVTGVVKIRIISDGRGIDAETHRDGGEQKSLEHPCSFGFSALRQVDNAIRGCSGNACRCRKTPLASPNCITQMSTEPL